MLYFLPIVKKKNQILIVVLLCGVIFLHSKNTSNDITGYFCESHRHCTEREDKSCDVNKLNRRTESRLNQFANDFGLCAEGTQSNKSRKSQTNPTLRIIDWRKNPRYLHSSQPSHIHRSPVFVAPKASYRLMIIGRLTI